MGPKQNSQCGSCCRETKPSQYIHQRDERQCSLPSFERLIHDSSTWFHEWLSSWTPSFTSTVPANHSNGCLCSLSQQMFILHGSTCFHFILLHSVKCFPSMQFGSTSILEALSPDPFWFHLVSNHDTLFLSLVWAYPRYSKSPTGLPWNNTHC